MPYQVPQNIDPNRIFVVNFSELEGRLDPQFYTKHFLDIVDRVKKCKRYCRLYQIAHFSSEYWNQKDIYENEFPYIEIGAINIEDGTIEQVSRIPIEEAPSRAKVIVRTDDIIVSTTRPNRGAIVKITKDENLFIASTGFSVIREIDSSINPDYLLVVLKLSFTLEQLLQRSAGGNYPAITQEELGKILIPIPQLPIQQKVIDYYKAAKNEKRQKDLQAKAVLCSIDDYLLNELGIVLPKKETQSLQDRIFIVNFSEVSGRRFDPKLYSTPIDQLKQSLFKSSFDNHQLKDFIKNSCSGEWGKDESEEVDENKYTKCLVIRATEFDNTYNLKLDNSRVKYRWIENSKLSKMNIQTNDLLIEKSGGSEDQPVGRISILTDEILTDNRIAYSNFIHKVSVEGINPMYLYFYLKTMHNIGITDAMQSQTNGIRNLIMSEYFNQTVVVPPLSKQQEIATHISEMKAKAKQLQTEGAEILRQAKDEVERMILAPNS